MPDKTESTFLHIGNAACHIADDIYNLLSFTGDLALALYSAARNPRRIKWKSTLYYMDCCGTDAVPIICLLGMLVGVILAFQAIVQLTNYGVSAYVVKLVGTTIVRELGPLITAIVLAGRSGSAYAAELGTMKASEEIDALHTMGMDPSRFLIVPKVIALVAVMPLLTILADVSGIIGGMLITCAQIKITVAEYYFQTIDVVTPMGIFQGLLKSVVFALIISAIGCQKGLEAERDAQGVGRASTSAVVSAIFIIVIADAVITAMFSM